MTGSDYYIPALTLAIALVVKLPSLWRSWDSPMSRSIFAIIVTAAGGFVFGAPPTVERINRLTGVPNISALIVYCILSAFSCASLVLLMHWRGGPEGVIRRHTRLWIAATACAMLTFSVLFALSDAPVERQRDLDTYYVSTPFIREMIVLYLASHTGVCLVVITKCWRWARELEAGWTRRGLLALVTGYALSLSYSVLKFVAVGARWAGTDDWDTLSTDIAPPLAGLGAGMTTMGFLLPVVGPRFSSMWQAWRAYKLMEPLWHALEPWNGIGTPMKIPKWSMFEMRATLRATEIADRLLNLAPYLDASHRAAAARYVEAEGYDHEAALIVTEAATIHAALATKTIAWADPDRAPVRVEGGEASLHPVRIAGTYRLTELSRQFSKIKSADLLVGAATSESN
ncbi:MAB_1171c family putative transporter [Streptomyces erythrochromogenes]|uniref:MAB_1171c family putative transporter n=1 Tax=Streptomyces erythrochromogenes TaxID=285574 RepID=UPI00341A67C1